MPVPATTGQLRTKISEMEIGDYIVWRSDGKYYYMDDKIIGTERPITGENVTNLPYANSYWYGIKVAKGLIISDRVIQHTVSWDSLHSSKLIQGMKLIINKFDNIIDYQTDSSQTRGLLNETEYIARTSNSTWQGANLIIREPEYQIDVSEIIEIEYDAFLTGFYNTAPNHYLSLSDVTNAINRDTTYGIHEYTTAPVRLSFNNSQPSLNVWHKFKHVLNFATKTCQTYVDGVLINVPNYTFNSVADGTKLAIQIGVGTYNYSANNIYKNITIKQGSQPTKLVKFGEKEGLMRSPSGGIGYRNQYGIRTTKATEALGAFPINNEWDRFLLGFNKIKEGMTLDDVFHHMNIWTFTNDIPALGSQVATDGTQASLTNVQRVIRGYEGVDSKWKGFGGATSNVSGATSGFRPVFDYKE